MKRFLLVALVLLLGCGAWGQDNGGGKVKRGYSVGDMFRDFTVKYDGKEQKLSDYVGNGKYMLVDFWASWCGPCKREIPGLIEIYKKYRGENFSVLGVALNDNPASSMNLVVSMGIPYPQILNAKSDVALLYNIKGIPEIMLFSPDGKILYRGLRGPQIEEAVKSVLGK